MVRKRSKGAKRYRESDDEPETESDYEDEPVYKPENRKYSLRQRKRPTFNSDDYEYEEDLLETPARAEHSDDEDFEVRKSKPAVSKVNKTPRGKESDSVVNTIEPEEHATEAQDELVDFEDMIRADIVMNKNRIDYDNVIQKTEIKVQPLSEVEAKEIEKKRPKQQQSFNKPKGKRGRKPKRRNDIELDEPQFLAPQIQENENDEDYHPYKPKRTRKPKARPAGEIDSSILEDIDDYDFEDRNDTDYNPDDDLEYAGLSGLSNYILDKQIVENNIDNTQDTTEETSNPSSNFDNSISTPLVNSSVCETSPDTTAFVNASKTPCQEPVQLAPAPELNPSPSLADTTSATTFPDTTDSAQIENHSVNSSSCDNTNNDVADDDVPRQLNEQSGNFEKVTSTSYASVIRVNETVVNSDFQINGNAKHIENPELNLECKSEPEDEDDDDDVVFIEDERKCEVIVLDD